MFQNIYLTRCWQAEGALYCVKENEDALLSSRKFKNEYAFREYNFNGCFITEQLPFSFTMEAICIFFTFFHWCEHHHLHHQVGERQQEQAMHKGLGTEPFICIISQQVGYKCSVKIKIEPSVFDQCILCREALHFLFVSVALSF